MAYTVIATPTIDTIKLREIASDLLEELVHGDASPFKDMKDVLEDYLDTAPELDPTQKAGIFADTLKGMYKDINNQVLNAAIEVLKSNGDFELERYKVQAGYNTTEAGLPKIEEEVKLTAAQVLKVQKETAILGDEKALKEAQIVEMRAKLKKQYGVEEEVVMQLSDNGTDKFRQYTNGVWYLVDVNGNFVDGIGTIIADPTVSGVPAEVTTVSLTSTLDNTVEPGAIDKQIRGYDMVNLKDVLKTADERAALMQNAKVPETSGEKLLRKELIEAITGAAITTDGSGNIDGVSDIVV